ncbi:L-fuculokinase, partial [Chloroflexota bacterium]
MESILSIDLGTTALKVSLFDDKGKLLALSNKEYKLLTPTTLGVELEVETYWNAFKEGIGEVIRTIKADTIRIRALGISAQGETLIVIDKEGNPLRNAIVWLDNRAQEESEILAAEFTNEASHKVTGQVKIVPTWPASKIFWIKRNEQDTFRMAYKYLLIEDYFIYRLTGRFVAEGSLLCSTMYWNITTKKWWGEMLKFLGISPEQLPEIKESGERVAEILPSVASELGLSPDTMVTTGALDQAAGAIGVGNIKPGIFSENTGAALAICA